MGSVNTILILVILGVVVFSFFKPKNQNDNNNEIKQDKFNDFIKTNTSVKNENNIGKIIALAFYNCIIVYLILSTDFSDWGGLIIGSIVSLMILIGNPLLTGILFRKNSNKSIIILISLISTIILTSITGFFGNPNNINNLMENNKEEKEINSILTDTNNNIEIYSNDEFKMLINSNEEYIYLIYNKKENGYNANVAIQKNNKLLKLKLVQTSISENVFNEYLLLTKNINNEIENITMNIKYKTIDNKEDIQVMFKINDKYYIYENDGREWIFNNILKENSILQEKLFSIIENKDYISDKTEYKYDFYADETFDYLILYNEHIDKFEYYQTYKCDFENKSNSERLKEFLSYINYDYNYKSFNTGKYTEYIINNGKIEKVIIYKHGNNMTYIEIFPNNHKKSIFAKVSILNRERIIIKDSVTSQNVYYDVSD